MTVLFFYGSSTYKFKNPAHTRRFQMAESSLDECLQQNSRYTRTVAFIYIGRPDCMIIINQYLNRLTEIAFCAHYKTISTMFYMVVLYIRVYAKYMDDDICFTGMAKLYIQQSYIVYRQGRNYIALYFALLLVHGDIFFNVCTGPLKGN